VLGYTPTLGQSGVATQVVYQHNTSSYLFQHNESNHLHKTKTCDVLVQTFSNQTTNHHNMD
jgi:hypothetical protein